eukprot:7418158-Pyramimonas_sp.AAC.1
MARLPSSRHGLWREETLVAVRTADPASALQQGVEDKFASARRKIKEPNPALTRQIVLGHQLAREQQKLTKLEEEVVERTKAAKDA